MEHKEELVKLSSDELIMGYNFLYRLADYTDPRQYSHSWDANEPDENLDEKTLAKIAVLQGMATEIQAVLEKRGVKLFPRHEIMVKPNVMTTRTTPEEEEDDDQDEKYFGASTLAKLRASK